MKKLILLGLICLSGNLWAKSYDFNGNWEFRKESNPEWCKATLPHTAHIEPYISNDMWMGTALYRKVFDFDESWKNKKVFVEFEGAMTVARVKLNGTLLTTHYGGYMGFEVDLTNDLLTDKKNILEVELDNREMLDVPPGKPYQKLDFAWFSGLYRNVKLHVKSPVYITNPISAEKQAGGGIFVTFPKVSGNAASIMVQTHIRNEHVKNMACVVRQELVHNGKKVAFEKSPSTQVSAGGDATVKQKFVVRNPKLWFPQSPHLYTLKTSVVIQGKVVDSQTQRIGIRSIVISPDAFEINGKKMYLRGTNRHQEYPYIGYAASDRAQYRDAQKIKEAGFDIVRLSHYPQSPAFYRACDALGLMVIDCITGWQWYRDGDFAERSLQEAREMIRRDRNHPSVVMWETSLNESPMPDGFLEKLHDIVDEEYPGDQSISLSFNGKYHDVFGPARQHTQGPAFWDDWKNGNQPLFTVEYGDWEYYANNAANFNQSGVKELKKEERTSRQLRRHGEARLLQMALNYQESHNQNLRGKSIIGDANWLMFDYNRGYANDHCSSGIMDLMRLPKFAYYFYKSQRDPSEKSDLFDSGPMVFAATYWNDKSNPKVRVFSNCDEVVAYLNGKEMARQKPDFDMFSSNISHPPFTFDYGNFTPGELRFIGLIGGKEVADHLVKTPEEAVNLKLFVDTHAKPLKADGNDFIIVYAAVVDGSGTIVPDANHELEFSVEGGAVLIGPNTVRTEAGINGVLVGQAPESGKISISVVSEGLKSDRVNITAE